MELENLKRGNIGLIQQTEDGRIIQIGLTPEQSNLLQIFLGTLSKESPLIQLGEEYELEFKNK